MIQRCADVWVRQGLDEECFSHGSLNAFMEHPAHVWSATRARITALLEDGPMGSRDLRDAPGLRNSAFVPRAAAQMHLPAHIGDFTDFYASREHAYNCGCMFRSPENALQPNWLHLPVAYHGRASTVVVSGTPVVRPEGQLQRDKANPQAGSEFGASRLLDFECEMGVFLGGEANMLGEPIGMHTAEQRIFGLVLLNDWSARDIQAWEYVPLGPFTSKNFASSISPWVVPYEALAPFACVPSAGAQEPAPLRYLQDEDFRSFDICLSVDIQTQGMAVPVPVPVCLLSTDKN